MILGHGYDEALVRIQQHQGTAIRQVVRMRGTPMASPPINVRVTKDRKEHEGEYYTTRGLRDLFVLGD